jgi:hypothetical protein
MYSAIVVLAPSSKTPEITPVTACTASYIAACRAKIRLAVEKNPLAGFGEPQPTLCSIDAPGVEMLFALAHLEGHGGLAHAKDLRRPGETERPGHGMKHE